MGKRRILFVAVCIMICFSACDKSEKKVSVENEVSLSDNYQDVAKELCEQMAKGEFSDTADKFSGALKNQLTKSQLEAVWVQTVDSLGEFENFIETDMTVKGDTSVTTSVLQYENGGLQVTISFDNKGGLVGIYLNYCSIDGDEKSTAAESNEIFTEYNINIGDYSLNGMLTVPNNVQDPPVAILVQGSGQTDMNEQISGIKPFQDLAHGLAEHGIATIRFNKRFYQFPDLYSELSTIEDEVLDDVYSAIKFAQEDSRVSNDNIFVIGHSLGGMLCPKIAYDSQNITGIISMAGSPRKLEDIILDQNIAYLKTLDIDVLDKNIQIDLVKQEVNKIKQLSDSDNGSEHIFECSVSYWKSLNHIKTEDIINQITLPMFFVQGDEDSQVYADVDFEQWKELLSDRDNCSFKLYEGLNHLFIDNGESEEDENQQMDDTVIEDISKWILMYSE
jgi:dienelactone hydrolase